MQTPVRKIALSREPTPKRRPVQVLNDFQSLMTDIRSQKHQTFELKDRINSLESQLSTSFVKSPKKTQPSQSVNLSINKQRFVTPPARVTQPIKPEQLSNENSRLHIDLNNVCKSSVSWLSNRDQINFRKVLTERRDFENDVKMASSRPLTPFRNHLHDKSIEDIENNISNLRNSLQRQREYIYDDKENSLTRKQMESKYFALLKTVEDVSRQVENTRYQNVILETEIKSLRG